MRKLLEQLGLAQPDSAARRLATGVTWTTAAALSTKVVAFAATILVARLLGQQTFGRFGILNATVASFSILGSLGMGVAATKLVAQSRDRDRDEAGRLLASCVVAAVLMGAMVAGALAMAAPWMARAVLRDPGLTGELRLCSLALFFLSWSAAQGGALAGLEAFSTMARISIASAIGSSAMVAAGAVLGGFRGAIVALPASAAAQCLIQEVLMRRLLGRHGISLRYGIAASRLGPPLAIGVPAMLSAALFLPTNWICSALLVREAGYEQVAVFTASDQWFNLVLTLPAILGQVLLPVLTNVFAQNDHEASRRLVRRLVLVNTVASWVPFLVLAPVSSLLLRIYGGAYAPHWPVLCILVAAACTASSLSPAGYALTATGQLWIAFFMNLGWAIAYLAAFYVLVVRLHGGAEGTAWARLVAYGFHALWSVWYLRVVLRNGTAGLSIRR